MKVEKERISDGYRWLDTVPTGMEREREGESGKGTWVLYLLIEYSVWRPYDMKRLIDGF